VEFFSWAGLGSLSGAVAAVVVVTNTVRKLTKLDSVWVPFVVSVLVVYGLALVDKALANPAGWVIAFLNSCLLFCTALGVNDTLVQGAHRPAGDAVPFAARRVRWWQTWLRRNGSD